VKIHLLLTPCRIGNQLLLCRPIPDKQARPIHNYANWLTRSTNKFAARMFHTKRAHARNYS
jgi:hypothetical protein